VGIALLLVVTLTQPRQSPAGHLHVHTPPADMPFLEDSPRAILDPREESAEARGPLGIPTRTKEHFLPSGGRTTRAAGTALAPGPPGGEGLFLVDSKGRLAAVDEAGSSAEERSTIAGSRASSTSFREPIVA
jgi:hypothetical protein